MNHVVKSGSNPHNRTAAVTDRTGSALWAGLSFVLPAAVMLVVLAAHRITPFGNDTLITEGGFAWFEDFCRLHETVIKGSGLFYSFQTGFGSSMYVNAAGGQFTPFLAAALLFPSARMAAAYSVMAVLRAGFCGLFAWLALRKVAAQCSRPFVTAMACAYALSGFTACAAYYPSAADGAVWFPLLVMGIYSYVTEARCLQLFLFGSLFFITCPSLFGGGMVMAMLFYFVFYFRRDNRRLRIYKLAVFAAVLFCSLLSAAFLLLPMGAAYEADSLFVSARSVNPLVSLCFGGYGTSAEGASACLCLASLPLMGLFAFWLNEKIGLGEKLCVAGAAVVSVAACAFAPLGSLLCGCCGAAAEAANMAFVLALTAVYGTTRCFSHPDGLPLWGAGVSVGGCLALAAVSTVLYGEDAFALMSEWGLLVVLAALFVRLAYERSLPTLPLSCAAAAVVVLFGILHVGAVIGGISSDYGAEALGTASLHKTTVSRAIARSESENERSLRFFRTRCTDSADYETIDLRKNDVPGFVTLAERLGIRPTLLSGGGENFTPLTDTLFAVGYVITNGEVEELGEMVQSPAYVIDSAAAYRPEGDDAFAVQNDVASKWFGVEQLFTEASVERVSRITSAESERYKWIFDSETTVVDKYDLCIEPGDRVFVLAAGAYAFAVENDSRSGWQTAASDGVYELSLPADQQRVVVYVSYDLGKEQVIPQFRCMSQAALDELTHQAEQRGAEYISQRGNAVRFMLHARQGQVAVTSVPFEEGWHITVNGKPVEPLVIADGLIGIELTEGSHSIVMQYRPPLFRWGAALSVIALVLGLYLALYTEHERTRRRKVRMAFRAVELDLNRRTAKEMERLHTLAQENTEADAADDDRNMLSDDEDTWFPSEDAFSSAETASEAIAQEETLDEPISHETTAISDEEGETT